MSNPCPCQPSTPSTDGPTIWAAVLLVFLAALISICGLFSWAMQ